MWLCGQEKYQEKNMTVKESENSRPDKGSGEAFSFFCLCVTEGLESKDSEKQPLPEF
jgi:hypothetical protein